MSAGRVRRGTTVAASVAWRRLWQCTSVLGLGGGPGTPALPSVGPSLWHPPVEPSSISLCKKRDQVQFATLPFYFPRAGSSPGRPPPGSCPLLTRYLHARALVGRHLRRCRSAEPAPAFWVRNLPAGYAAWDAPLAASPAGNAARDVHPAVILAGYAARETYPADFFRIVLQRSAGCAYRASPPADWKSLERARSSSSSSGRTQLAYPATALRHATPSPRVLPGHPTRRDPAPWPAPPPTSSRPTEGLPPSAPGPLRPPPASSVSEACLATWLCVSLPQGPVRLLAIPARPAAGPCAPFYIPTGPCVVRFWHAPAPVPRESFPTNSVVQARRASEPTP